MVEHHDRRRVALAGLDEGDELERLVEGAESAGEERNASLSFMKNSFRVKKYRNVASFGSPSMMSTALCSNGNTMFTPKVFSVPAPSIAACMIPGPAPLMIIHSSSAMARPNSTASW